MQLDIFEHSREIMLRNDVLDALQRREATAARAAWDTLRRVFPQDETVTPLAVLIDALAPPANAAFVDHACARDARLQLTAQVGPAASRLFGDKAGAAWLGPQWGRIAERAARLPFHARHSEDHAAVLWLHAGDWPAAAHAVAGIESWRRIPAPLAWMAEARYRIDGLDAVWELLAELAWLSPARLDELRRKLADPLLDKLHKRFHTSFEGEGRVADLAWFPAWLLIETPGLARLLGQAQASQQDAPERAMRLLLDLLALERQGRHRDLVERRRDLRDLNAALFAAYIKTR